MLDLVLQMLDLVLQMLDLVLHTFSSLLHFENLCVARCRHDWSLRTSLAKESEGQMSIVSKLPDVLAQSRAFISGRSKKYMASNYMYKSPCHVPF